MRSFLFSCLAVFFAEAQTTVSHVFDSSIFTRLLLSDYYGRQTNPGNFRNCHINPQTGRRRCHREADNLAPLLYLASFKTVVTTACYPDYATFERLQPNGEFETVPIANLVLGDMVKCLKAPMGPVTMHPKLDVCKYMSVGHNDVNGTDYNQIFYQENGETKMMALSPTHMLWSSRDDLKEGVVDGDDIKISADMFVEARLVRVGDVILVDADDTLQYRKVTALKVQNMPGMHNPNFLDGGLPFVNGVLGTTTPGPRHGNHWNAYYRSLWLQDAKFVDPVAAGAARGSNPWFLAEGNGNITVNNDCFLHEIIKDMQAGVDVSAYTDYQPFAEEYIRPCAKIASDEFNVMANLKQLLTVTTQPQVQPKQVENLKQVFGLPRVAFSTSANLDSVFAELQQPKKLN